MKTRVMAGSRRRPRSGHVACLAEYVVENRNSLGKLSTLFFLLASQFSQVNLVPKIDSTLVVTQLLLIVALRAAGRNWDSHGVLQGD